MPGNTTKPTNAEHIAAVHALTHVLIDICGEGTHQVALEALLTAFTAVAVAFPRCTQGAAHLARNVAALIETRGTAHAPHIH